MILTLREGLQDLRSLSKVGAGTKLDIPAVLPTNRIGKLVFAVPGPGTMSSDFGA